MNTGKIMIKTIIAAILLLSLIPLHALAGMRVSPAIIRTNLSPGGSYNTLISVQNTSKEKIEYLKIYLESNEQNPEGKWKYTKNKGGVMSMISWAGVAPDRLTILPGEKADISMKIKLPKNVSGDFRVAIMVEQDQSKGPPPPPIELDDVDDIRLGKYREKDGPKKIGVTLIKYMRVAIPVYIRARQPSKAAKEIMPEVKIGKVKIGAAQEGQGAFKAFVLVENSGTFDVEIKGVCNILHPKNRSALKIAELSGGNITIMPKSKRQVEFVFSDALPVGNYIASANLKFNTRGFKKIVRKQAKTKFAINDSMAKKLLKLATSGSPGGDTPFVPLLVEPDRIDLTTQGTRIKPLKLIITNPTNQTLNVRSIFRSASQSKKGKPSVKIIPDKFSIEPGKSERIRVQIKPASKGPVYGRLLFAVKGMGGSRPAEVPIMILPKGVKLNPSGSIADFEVLSVKDGKSVRISGKLKNTGNAHLNDISAEISIRDFLDNPVKKHRASVNRKILFPAEKTRLSSDFSLSDLKDDTYKAVFIVKSKGAKTISESFRFKVDSKSDEVVTLVD